MGMNLDMEYPFSDSGPSNSDSHTVSYTQIQHQPAATTLRDHWESGKIICYVK